MLNRVVLSSWLLACMTALSGCGESDNGSEAATTQAAASVNGKEISIHQLNDRLLQLQPNLQLATEGERLDAGRKVLESLIDQELLVQQAKELKLDRDLKVMRALAAAEREVLARAYIERISSGSGNSVPSAAEVRDFYQQHPELFSQRKIFSYREVRFAISPEAAESINAAIAAATTIADFEQWLVTQQIKHQARDVVAPAEQIPLEQLPYLAKVKVGEVAMFNAGPEAALVYMASIKDQPLDEQTAEPFIHQYLSSQQNHGAAEIEIKRLREKSEITYAGPFAESTTAPRAE